MSIAQRHVRGALSRSDGQPGKQIRSGKARADIQGLRALAVIAVIGNHLVDWPGSGFVGVDVFFVISGYLITGLLVREHDRTGSISYRGFYARRVKRVVPAAVTVLFVTVVISGPVAGADQTRETLVDAVWAFFFASNWRFASKTTDYFQEGLRPSPLQHYWSLGVEEQFYLVWPWLMLALFAWAAHKAWSRHRSLVTVGTVIATLSIASFVWGLHSTETNQAGAYFSSFTRIWELGIGAGVAVAAGTLRRIPRPLTPVLAWAGLALIVVSLFVVPSTQGFPAPWAGLPVIGTAMVIAAGEPGYATHLVPLTNRISGYVGDISYSLYLWHFPVIILLQSILLQDTAGYYLAATALTSGLSVASFHLIEDPVRRSDWLTGRGSGSSVALFERRRVQVGVVCVIGFALMVLGVQALKPADPPAESFRSLQDRLAAETSGTPCLGAAAIGSADTCVPVGVGAVYPSPEKLRGDFKTAYACFVEYDVKEPDVCSHGVRKPKKRIAVVGDSHAATLLAAMSAEADRRAWRVDSYVGHGCIWGASNRCPSLIEASRRFVRGDYDVVVTTGYRRRTPGDPGAVIAGLKAAWRPVLKAGVKVVVVADNPGVGDRAMQCITRRGVDAEDSCTTPLAEATSKPDLLVAAANELGTVPVVDLQRFYCDGKTCPAVIGNVLVYSSKLSHVTETYSVTLGPYLAEALENA